ncbi:AIM24 family protein [Flexivirga caeni]|uniref:AIM24 family protein n=1 Tax=Flexivirga caeni TaxID=2294115 RepID=A0A3M9M9J3_9MICO|nr:AIM24 family protein [Flexivirga caeni]RNI22241.1 hypothetical protein EFY87_09720 [Flexivirga caeni]
MTNTTYECPYCRMPSDGQQRSCPSCGAPIDVTLRTSDSGWIELPPLRDMTKLYWNRSTCEVSGKYVPMTEMELGPEDGVYFSHHVLLHADSRVQLDTLPMKGGFKRMMAGLPLVMMTAHGPGSLAFSEDAPGETIAVPLRAGQAINVHEHRFLVASSNVSYDWYQAPVWYSTRSGNDTEYFYPIGQFVDRFQAQGQHGLLMLHAPGNVLIRDLAPRESILVQPSSLIYYDGSVRLSLVSEQPGGAAAGSFNRTGYQSTTLWLSASGPGRIAIASVFERPEPPERWASGIEHRDW